MHDSRESASFKHGMTMESSGEDDSSEIDLSERISGFKFAPEALSASQASKPSPSANFVISKLSQPQNLVGEKSPLLVKYRLSAKAA